MANLLTKIYSFSNLWRQQTKSYNTAEQKYLPYFDGFDNFPLKWHQIISESPSATSCVSTITDFLEGYDFSDPELSKVIVNAKGETFYQIHQRTCKDFAEFEGFYWHFMFDGAGRITTWNVLPFENCRLGKPDSSGYISKIYYNPYFGTGDYQTVHKDTILYDTFNLDGVKAQIAKDKTSYRGQVLFVGTTTALSRFYPLPEAYSSKKWMEVEKGTSDYHEDNINNGLLQPFMLIMKGNPNEPSKNPEYADQPEAKRKTRGQEFDEVVSSNFMGAKRVGNMWVQWVENPDEKPEILSFPSNNSGDLFVTIDNQATKKITIAFKVPAVLANIHEGVSLGGDGNQIRVAVKLMQHRVKKRQRILTDAYEKVFKIFYRPYVQTITITPYNPYPELEVLDQKIWDALTPEERRKWINDNTEIELFSDDDLQDGTTTPAARVTNAIPTEIPESIRNSVKKALDFSDNLGLSCITKGGREVSDGIINNSSMGYRQLKRIHSYLGRNSHYKDALFQEGCDAIKYHAWGGNEMYEFLTGELKKMDKWLNKTSS